MRSKTISQNLGTTYTLNVYVVHMLQLDSDLQSRIYYYDTNVFQTDQEIRAIFINKSSILVGNVKFTYLYIPSIILFSKPVTNLYYTLQITYYYYI